MERIPSAFRIVPLCVGVVKFCESEAFAFLGSWIPIQTFPLTSRYQNNIKNILLREQLTVANVFLSMGLVDRIGARFFCVSVFTSSAQKPLSLGVHLQ